MGLLETGLDAIYRGKQAAVEAKKLLTTAAEVVQQGRVVEAVADQAQRAVRVINDYSRVRTLAEQLGVLVSQNVNPGASFQIPIKDRKTGEIRKDMVRAVILFVQKHPNEWLVKTGDGEATLTRKRNILGTLHGEVIQYGLGKGLFIDAEGLGDLKDTFPDMSAPRDDPGAPMSRAPGGETQADHEAMMQPEVLEQNREHLRRQIEQEALIAKLGGIEGLKQIASFPSLATHASAGESSTSSDAGGAGTVG